MTCTTTVLSTCHCGANKFSIPLDTSTLPRSGACHCMACRKSTGVSLPTYLELQKPLFSGDFSSTLQAYQTSADATRYFCATCGAHIAMFFNDGKQWITTGTLDRIDGVCELGWHQYLKETLDGGITRDIPDGLPRWSVRDDGEEFVEPADLTKFPVRHPGAEVLKARCRCGGVKIEIERPSAHPDAPGAKERGSEDGKRWIACHCFCTDCRLVSGFPLVSWVFVGREHLHFAEPTTMKVYNSSTKVKRGFCSTCGAAVTYDYPRGWVDIAVALLEVEEGEGVAALEKEWLLWESEADFTPSARERPLVDALDRGLSSRQDSIGAS